MVEQKSILVTGATGYIGGRLVPRLIELGHKVRVLARDPERIRGRPWEKNVEIFQGDVLRPETFSRAMEDINVAYYLIHSMNGKEGFHKRDITAANNFGTAAKFSGVERIIYLGGLGEPDADLSEHLRSRQDTGRELAKAGVPVTEFRAAIIVGSGSISFEMIRYLTERIPIMICPRWVFTRVQPIAINDVLAYLTTSLEVPESSGKVVEIGGTDVITYGEMMMVYAEVRGLKRLMIPVPVLTPRLSSHWVHWTTPVPASITRPLIEGLRNEVIVRDTLARQLFPNIHPMNYRTAVEKALVRLYTGEVETRWTDSLASSQGDKRSVVLKTEEGLIIEQRCELVDAPQEIVYQTFSRLGGEQGWLYFDWAWELRGSIDRLFGGVGLRRGRRNSNNIRVGEAIDFWRVEAVNHGNLLRLRAEMKVPGLAWLQFESQPFNDNQTKLLQTAYFAPKGLTGFLYWYILYPFHSMIFSGLIRKLKTQAEGT